MTLSLPTKARREPSKKMKISRNSDTLTVDIHGMRVEAARFRLESLISGSSTGIKKLIVIHGSNNGHALRDMVRNELNMRRIKSISPVFANDGQTVIFLQG